MFSLEKTITCVLCHLPGHVFYCTFKFGEVESETNLISTLPLVRIQLQLVFGLDLASQTNKKVSFSIIFLLFVSNNSPNLMLLHNLWTSLLDLFSMSRGRIRWKLCCPSYFVRTLSILPAKADCLFNS